MAKRFTDTQKWHKAWFRQLGSKLRDVRAYVLDSCDHAGIWELDLDTATHFIGEPVTLGEIYRAFRDRVVIVDDKIFIPDFVEFQYGELSEDSKPHQAVIARLKKLGIFEQYTKGMYTLKDKDKEKDKEKEKEREPKKPVTPISDAAKLEAGMNFDFDALIDLYPKLLRGSKAKAVFREHIHDQETYDDWVVAITNFKNYCDSNGQEGQFVLGIENFAKEWRDWARAGPKAKKYGNGSFTGFVPD